MMSNKRQAWIHSSGLRWLVQCLFVASSLKTQYPHPAHRIYPLEWRTTQPHAHQIPRFPTSVSSFSNATLANSTHCPISSQLPTWKLFSVFKYLWLPDDREDVGLNIRYRTANGWLRSLRLQIVGCSCIISSSPARPQRLIMIYQSALIIEELLSIATIYKIESTVALRDIYKVMHGPFLTSTAIYIYLEWITFDKR